MGFLFSNKVSQALKVFFAVAQPDQKFWWAKCLILGESHFCLEKRLWKQKRLYFL